MDIMVEQMIKKGFVKQVGPDQFDLTESGRSAFVKMVESDPKLYAKEFPEWVKLEYIH